MKSRLSQDQINKIIDLFNKGLQAQEIEKIMGISHQTMWRISKQLNLTFVRGKRSDLTQEQLNTIKELAATHTAVEISKIIGISYRVVQTAFKNLDLKPKGVKLDPLTEDQNNKVIELFNQGRGTRFISKNIGVSRDAINNAFKDLKLDNSGRSAAPRTAHLATEKTCKICKNTYTIDKFRKRVKGERISYESYCLECESIYNKRANNERYYKKWDERKLYRQNNKHIINAAFNKRYNIDNSFKLRKIVSRQIRGALKNNNSSKDGNSCLKYLSYSIDELKQHLESQFEPWMNWQNHGIYDLKTWNDNDNLTWTWQIDHIVPQSDLPYESMEDENFKKCWSLENLRPLSAKQNLLDGVNKIRHNK